MSIQGLQVFSTEIRYIFPKELRSISEFVRVGQIKKKLKDQFKQFANILPNYPYRPYSQSFGNIYMLKCIYCKNRLQYRLNLEKGKFQLKRFNLDHVHGINFDKQQIRLQSQLELFTSDNKHINQILRQKIQKLCQPIAKHLSKGNSNHQQHGTFQQLVAKLRQDDCFVSFQPENFRQMQLIYPDYLLVISQQMKKSYQTQARCIGIDFTYNLIKQTPLTQAAKKPYMIGFIVGLNSYRRICIYALVVVNEQNGYYVQKIFTQFIKVMGREPESIVSDQSIGVLAGIKRIKQKGVYRGNSYWDTFHVLKNYKFRHRQLKSHMRRMIRVKCKYQFHKMYLQAVTIARNQGEMDAIHKFMHQSHKYCMSQIQADFVGLGVSDSQNQAINNLVKIQLPHESKYIDVVTKIIPIAEQRNLLSKAMIRQYCRAEQVINKRQLGLLRLSLCRKVCTFLFYQLINSYKVNITYRDPENKQFYCLQDAHTAHYVTKMNIEDLEHLIRNKGRHIKDGFKCSCKFQQKTGVPCEHILKIILETDNNFIDRIDQYWVVEQPDRLMNCISSYGEDNTNKIKKRGRPIGKRPLMYMNPEKKAEVQLPPGISTFEPIKIRKGGMGTLKNENQNINKAQSQIYSSSNQEDQFEGSMMDEQKKNNVETKRRAKMIKSFYT